MESNGHSMEARHEAHLSTIQAEAISRINDKYRRGQVEHGGDLWKKDPIELIDDAIDEAVDQFVYLLTLKAQLLEQKQGGVNA